MVSTTNSVIEDLRTLCPRSRCDLRGDCWVQANKRFFDRFFSDDWQTLVIRRDPETGNFKMDKVEKDR